MTFGKPEIEKLALHLHEARLSGAEVDPLATTSPGLTVLDAYKIQREGIRLRLQMGEKIIGYKMGLTSKAKREQMKLDSPVYGVLTDRMQVQDGSTLSLKTGIHPKIEPEIAFMTGKDLQGSVTPDDVLSALSGVCAALEILDSRYRGFQYFSLPDVIADNSSSSLFVVGKLIDNFQELDFKNLSLKMNVNGKTAHQAPAHAISGNPVLSVTELCRLLQESGEVLPAGSLVLAGAATPAVALEPGMHIELTVDPLPSVSLQIEK